MSAVFLRISGGTVKATVFWGLFKGSVPGSDVVFRLLHISPGGRNPIQANWTEGAYFFTTPAPPLGNLRLV